MSTDFKLSIQRDLKLSEIPSEETIVQAGYDIINSTYSWKAGKTYHKVVHTSSRAKGAGDGAPWHCRVSEHTKEDATFDEFWSKLMVDHPLHEKEYIKEVKKAKLVKKISPTMEVWTMYYEFPPPVSPRIFTIVQVTHQSEGSPRQGLFIQIPIDLSEDLELAKLEEKGTRGHYTSVESIKELEDGRVEWRMATSSTPGGRIPSFVVESTMASQIAADVPHFLHWFHGVRDKPTGATTVTGKATPEAGAEGKAAVDSPQNADILPTTNAEVPILPTPGVAATGVPSVTGPPVL